MSHVRTTGYGLVTLTILISFLMPPAAALVGPGDHLEVLVNKTGDNFLWWSWYNTSLNSDTAPNLTKTVFVDTVKVVDNTTMDYYLLSDLNPDEKHVIEVRGYNVTLNTLNTTVIRTDKTFEQDIWTLFLIGIGLIIVGWFTAPLIILLSIPMFLLGFAFALDMTTQTYLIWAYGFGIGLSMLTFVLRWGY